MSKKTTWVDKGSPDCEEKDYAAYEGKKEHGKSTMIIVCPYCESHVTAYKWSLCAGGKRCGCGALFGSRGIAYKLKEPEQT